jgi:hypothetical protein
VKDLLSGPHWPNLQQQRLLRASLGHGEAALSAWTDWVNAGGLVAIDGASYEILPSVLANLTRSGSPIPEEGVLRGLHRRTWYQNRLLLARTTSTIAALQSAGIPTIVLKGTALLGLYYEDVGRRYMIDTDVLVRHADFDRAVETIRAAGWQPHGDEQSRARLRRLGHAFTFHSGEQALDLHWDVMPEARPPGTEAACWRRAVPVTIDGVTTRSLSPADLLIHVIVHSYRWVPSATLRWIVDTVAITTSNTHPVDWHTLVRESRRLRVTLMMEQSLRYAVTVGAAVPPEVLEQLAGSRRGWVERLHFRGSTGRTDVVDSVIRDLGYYLRISAYWSFWRRLGEIPAYLEMTWRVQSPKGLPAEAWQRLRGRRRAA